MKKLKFMLAAAAAIGLTTASQAAYNGSTDFEDLAIGLAPTNGLFKFEGAAGDNESEIVAGVPDIDQSLRPREFREGTQTKILQVSTGTDPLLRKIATDAQDVAGGDIYVDTLVQFTVTPSTDDVTTNAADKLLIYLKEDGNGATNLMVKAAYYQPYDDDEGTAEMLEPRDVAVISPSVVPGQWYRLTVKATVDNGLLVFNIWLDNTQLKLENKLLAGEDTGTDGYYAAFPSLLGKSSTTFAAVGFAGEGKVDDLSFMNIDPFNANLDFTFTWGNGLTPVSYTVSGTNTYTFSGNETSPFTNNLAYGATVSFRVANADGAVKTLSATAGTGGGQATNALDATGTTFGWAEYLGDADGVSGAYTIDDVNDLDMLRKGVAAGLPTAGTNFTQTADIDMAGEAEFAGIGTYNESSPTNGMPFSGTYDGQNYKISNVTMTARNYGGIFNQVGGGTIKNLTVEDISFLSGGFAIVGNFGGDGAVLQNLTAAGSFGDAGMPGTHNMAGIVVRACGGGETGALVKDCTNNATIYGNYTKLAGICAITQRKLTGAGITFDGCVNNGALNLSRTSTGVTGLAGIVGYESEPTVLVGCSNTGSLNNTASGANTDCNGQLVGYAYNQSLTDNGGNSAPSNAKMVAKYGTSTVTGFKYATVDNGVATTVTTLAKDTTYLLEGNVAASETPVFTLAAVGDTIAFDTALGYTFAGTVAAELVGVNVTSSTSGTVTTYTATQGGTPLNPGQDTGTTYNSQADAEAAALGVTIAPSSAVAAQLTTAQAEAYVTNFEAKVVSVGEGQYKVEVGLTADAEAALQAEVNADAAEVVDDLTEDDVTLTTTPGFYYSFEYGTSLDNMTEGARTLATGSSLTLPRPTTQGATSGFYRVLVNVAPAAQN